MRGGKGCQKDLSMGGEIPLEGSYHSLELCYLFHATRICKKRKEGDKDRKLSCSSKIIS